MQDPFSVVRDGRGPHLLEFHDIGELHSSSLLCIQIKAAQADYKGNTDLPGSDVHKGRCLAFGGDYDHSVSGPAPVNAGIAIL